MVNVRFCDDVGIDDDNLRSTGEIKVCGRLGPAPFIWDPLRDDLIVYFKIKTTFKKKKTKTKLNKLQTTNYKLYKQFLAMHFLQKKLNIITISFNILYKFYYIKHYISTIYDINIYNKYIKFKYEEFFPNKIHIFDFFFIYLSPDFYII